MKTGDDWSDEFALLRKKAVTLAPGLNKSELECVEELHSFRFPPDLRAFLACALPLAPGFPDWRAPRAAALHEQLAWPFEGIAFDIERNAFWLDAWGPRPEELREAIAVAKAAVASAPRLIPICGHRYMPAEPEVAGNPVFSVYQTDIIYYGIDLRRYLQCEFGGLDHGAATGGDVRRIRFWTEMVESDY